MTIRGWGATVPEAERTLVGDALVPRADFVVTRAITISSPPDLVWPWLAQLGQQQGGFYSYDRLENLFGCHIHSAERIHPEWQEIAVGDRVCLYPDVGLTVAVLDPGRAMVLHGGVPVGRRPAPFDFSWAFVLVDGPGQTCRLVCRERYVYLQRWASLVVVPTSVVSTVMTRRMLLGIRARSERDQRPSRLDALSPGATCSPGQTLRP